MDSVGCFLHVRWVGERFGFNRQSYNLRTHVHRNDDVFEYHERHGGRQRGGEREGGGFGLVHPVQLCGVCHDLRSRRDRRCGVSVDVHGGS